MIYFRAKRDAHPVALPSIQIFWRELSSGAKKKRSERFFFLFPFFPTASTENSPAAKLSQRSTIAYARSEATLLLFGFFFFFFRRDLFYSIGRRLFISVYARGGMASLSAASS
jgi:hypothetical protein